MVVGIVREFLQIHGIGPCRLVAGVSGGTDSTALLLALGELRGEGFDLVCGHVNHHIRGAEADEDERFVSELCERLGIRLMVADGTLDENEIRRSGVEAAAREVRTRRLLEIAAAADARFIATAHQRNDQAETIVMRMMTGSGIAGLRGIHPVRSDGFVRPLLDVSRKQIEDFLRERSVTPRVDRMNADPRYLRVRIRRVLSDFDETAITNIASVAAQAREQWTLLERLVDDEEPAAADIGADQTRFVRLPSNAWLRQALLHRHIQRLDPTREVSAADLERIATGVDDITRLTVTRNLELFRRGKTLILRRIPADAEDFELTIRAGQEQTIDEAGVTVSIRAAPSDASVASADRSRQVIQLPPGADPRFTVRSRRDGDRLHPLGAGGQKKLKDLLIDRKVPVEERDRTPIIVWNDEIVWVAGIEVSERFKVRDEPGDRYEIAIVQTDRRNTA